MVNIKTFVKNNKGDYICPNHPYYAMGSSVPCEWCGEPLVELTDELIAQWETIVAEEKAKIQPIYNEPALRCTVCGHVEPESYYFLTGSSQCPVCNTWSEYECEDGLEEHEIGSNLEYVK